jgi:hypothetical protein
MSRRFAFTGIHGRCSTELLRLSPTVPAPALARKLPEWEKVGHGYVARASADYGLPGVWIFSEAISKHTFVEAFIAAFNHPQRFVRADSLGSSRGIPLPDIAPAASSPFPATAAVLHQASR